MHRLLIFSMFLLLSTQNVFIKMNDMQAVPNGLIQMIRVQALNVWLVLLLKQICNVIRHAIIHYHLDLASVVQPVWVSIKYHHTSCRYFFFFLERSFHLFFINFYLCLNLFRVLLLFVWGF